MMEYIKRNKPIQEDRQTDVDRETLAKIQAQSFVTAVMTDTYIDDDEAEEADENE